MSGLVALTLSGCLPEDQNIHNVGEVKVKDSSSQLLGTKLGATFLQIQAAITQDSDWFGQYADGQFLNLANLGVTEEVDKDVRVKAVACPMSKGVMQVVWIDSKDEAGRFNVKRVGFNVSDMLTSLHSSVPHAKIGTSQSYNQIKLTNNQSLDLPIGCAWGKIPQGAPVLALEIDKVGAPYIPVSRIEYRTLKCPMKNGKRPAGSVLQKRTITLKQDGRIEPADPETGWEDSGVEGCVEETDLKITDNKDIGKDFAAVDAFASGNIKDVLKERLDDVNCRNVTLGKQSNEQSNYTINTCAQDLTVNANARAISQDNNTQEEERQIDCVGQSVQQDNPYSWLHALSGTQSVWEGLATIIRDRVEQDTYGSKTAAMTRWVGKPGNRGGMGCVARETLNATCDQLVAKPAGNEHGATVTLVNGGLVGERLNAVKDWADAVAMKPMAPTPGVWDVKSLNCEWQRKETPNCGSLADSDHRRTNWAASTMNFDHGGGWALLNTGPMRRHYVATRQSNYTIAANFASSAQYKGFVDLVHCGKRTVSTPYTRPATVTHKSCLEGTTQCTVTRTETTTVPVTQTDLDEWKSDIGHAATRTQYSWNNKGGTGNTIDFSAIPESFAWDEITYYSPPSSSDSSDDKPTGAYRDTDGDGRGDTFSEGGCFGCSSERGEETRSGYSQGSSDDGKGSGNNSRW